MTATPPRKAVDYGCYDLDDLSEHSAGSHYPGSVDAGDVQGADDRRRPIAIRLLPFLDKPKRRRKGGFDYEAALGDEASGGVLRRPVQRESRRCRRMRVISVVRRLILGLPVLALLLFGVLHVLQVLIGRARLFWDFKAYDDFMPDWGKPGHQGAGLAHYPTDATRDVLPIPCHSHNDYWRRIPLYDAIHWGCTGVEADVWLFDSELYVGHSLASLTRNRTFKNLYVNPLVDLLDEMNPSNEFANVSGRGVFDVDPQQTLVLLVDFKTNGRDLFPVVSDHLQALRDKDYLSFWDGDKLHSRAITVVGTGNTPFDMVVNNTQHRDIFFDAPLDKLWEPPRHAIGTNETAHDKDDEPDHGDALSPYDGNETPSGPDHIGAEIVGPQSAFNTSTSYYASTSFHSAVGFVWRGHLSLRQLEIIRGQIQGAKRRGLKVRYWDTPAWPISLRNHIWHVLVREGADMLNVDDLRGAAVENWKMRVHDWFR